MSYLPEVSIIIPIYNVEKYIEECIDSVLQQTFKNFEVILVNDGSTDNSYEIIQRYKTDQRCIIINKNNGGLSSARNAGFDVAKGKYIFFVDSDDTIELSALELLVKKMQETDADFCCYRISFIDEKSKARKVHGHHFKTNFLIGQENIIKDAFEGRNIKITAWSKIFKYSFLRDNNIRFLEGIINEDCLYTLTCAIYARKVAFLDLPLYNALKRNGSISRNIRRENITSYSSIFCELYKLLEKEKIYSIYSEYFLCSYIKQILFTLVQVAFKVDDKVKFLTLYKEMKGEPYLDIETGKHIKLLSRLYYSLYYLSLYPLIFYRSMRLLKALGIKMY